MLRSEEPVDTPAGRPPDPSEREPLRTDGMDGSALLAGTFAPEVSPRGLIRDVDRDREEGMFFGAACPAGPAERALLAATA